MNYFFKFLAVIFLISFTFSCEQDKLLEAGADIEQLQPDFEELPNCGTPIPTQEVINNILELRSKASNQRSSWMTYTIPIYVHFIRKSNGSSTISNSDILASIERTNNFYQSIKIKFVAARFNFIDNDTYYNYKTKDETKELALKYNEPGYINMYFYPNTESSWASFPSLDWDFVVMRYSHTTNPSTMAHELGHYLNLLHTHEDYRGAEAVNRNNCFETGDLMCDTPADPGLTGNVNSSCSYTGTDKDSNGRSYSPLTDNVMSYTRFSCRKSFTPHQENMMKMTLVTERKYLVTIEPSYGIGLYRPSTNDWYYDHDIDKTTDRKTENWGYSGDLPVSGSFISTFHGNGVALFRPSGGDWYFDNNKDGKTDKFIRDWGRNGDLPLAGNFTGTNQAGIALYRPSTGTWYFDHNLDGKTDKTLRWGSSYHKAAAGDFNGDGKFDIALYNPRNGNWALDFDLDGKTDRTIPAFGASTDRPFAGDFNGDGYYDLAVYRPSTNTWYFDIDLDGDNDFNIRGWGRSGDLPFAIK